MIEGIDISHHQSSTPSLAGKQFVVARASYGAHGDDMYFVHQRNVRKAGLVFGAYHFARPVSTGDTVDEQVRAFLLMAADADFLAFDWELDGRIGRMSVADARSFISKVQQVGHRIFLYASESSFRDLGQDGNWIANWSHVPTRAWDMWQYRGSPLDLDRYYGTVVQLKKFGLPTLPDTSTEGPEPMGPKLLNLVSFVGTAEVTAPGTSAIQLQDGELIALPVGARKDIVGKAIVVPPWPKHPSGVCYLVGSEPAILLAEDVAVHETPPLDCSVPVADATLAERNRIAAAEAARIRAI